MRTTIRLDDTLFKEVKRYALEHDTTFTAVVEAALKDRLARTPSQKPFELITCKGRELPGVDISNNAALRDLMDGLE